MARYDTVVVGAGPGGAAAAAHLARGGARVLLLDRVAFPRDKACGGGLTPRGVTALDGLGVATDGPAFVRVGGLEMTGGRRSVAVGFPATARWPAHGLVARRSDLDGAILEQALKAGAEFRSGVRVFGPVLEDGIVRGVRLGSNGSREEVLSDVVVAADGAQSALARGAGIASSPSSGRGFWYAALRGYFGAVQPRLHEGAPVLEFYPLRTPSGRWLPAYGWVFPLPGGTANVGVDVPHRPALSACPQLREAYDGFVAWLRASRPGFEHAVPEAPPVGALLPEAMCAFRPGAPGMLAVGDASGMITPYSGEGIVYALEGAGLAARAILQAPRPSAILQTYEREIWEGYGFQFRTALWIMKAMRKAPLARTAAALGLGHPRLLRAGVRVMAYLIDTGGGSPSTVSRAYLVAQRLAKLEASSLWS